MPSLKSLALDLDLSISTVARALREDRAIKAGTRARVAAAAREAGYRPSHAARALVSGRTRLIGLHLLSLQAFYVAMALRLERLAAADGYATVISTAAAPPATWASDGDICIGHLGEELERALGSRPVVAIAEHARADFVAVDLAAPTRRVVAHLVASGCRRIARLGPAWQVEDTCDEPRVRAYREAVTAAGLEPIWIRTADVTRASARAALVEHALTRGAPDAVVCHNDDLAIGAYRGARDLGLEVPEELSLVGCDGIEDGEFLDRPLSTIAQPLDEYCARLWACLRRRLADPALPQQRETLRARLTPRASTRPLEKP